MLTGGGGDIVSPTGDLVAVVDGRGVCLHLGPAADSGADFGTGTGTGRCVLSFAAGVTPSYAVFSPTGAHLLVVAGPANRSVVYVIDVGSGAVDVVGPQGVGSLGATAPEWNLSSALWDVDGASVLLVPRTDEATGAVIGFDLSGGGPSERARLPAELANSSPSLFSTVSGLALIATTGEQRNKLWWADYSTGAVDEIAGFSDPGGSLVLGGADPLGRTVLVCPRRADGRLGATVGISVADRRSAQVLPGSRTCAATVFSADGRYLAMADQMSDGYTLAVVEAATGQTLLRTRIPAPIPSVPPYLTWAGDVIVASDVTGEWQLPVVVARLTR